MSMMEKMFTNRRFRKMYDPADHVPNITVKKPEPVKMKPGKHAYTVKTFKEEKYKSQKEIVKEYKPKKREEEEDKREDVNIHSTLKDAM